MMAPLCIPVALATAFFLDLLWINVDVTRLGKVAREVVFRTGSAVSQAGVVAVVVLLSASH